MAATDDRVPVVCQRREIIRRDGKRLNRTAAMRIVHLLKVINQLWFHFYSNPGNLTVANVAFEASARVVVLKKFASSAGCMIVGFATSTGDLSSHLRRRARKIGIHRHPFPIVQFFRWLSEFSQFHFVETLTLWNEHNVERIGLYGNVCRRAFLFMIRCEASSDFMEIVWLKFVHILDGKIVQMVLIWKCTIYSQAMLTSSS